MDMLETEHGTFTNNVETGQTAQQVYEEWLLSALKPTQSEIEVANFEIKIITLLTELEVIL